MYRQGVHSILVSNSSIKCPVYTFFPVFKRQKVYIFPASCSYNSYKIQHAKILVCIMISTATPLHFIAKIAAKNVKTDYIINKQEIYKINFTVIAVLYISATMASAVIHINLHSDIPTFENLKSGVIKMAPPWLAREEKF